MRRQERLLTAETTEWPELVGLGGAARLLAMEVPYGKCKRPE